MSEENRKQGAEISEQSLEQVSGGGWMEIATLICSQCIRKKNKTCNHSTEELAEYISKGHFLVHYPCDCPFRNM